MYKKCRLNNSLISYINLHFPYKKKQKSSYKYRVVIGIGGNVGDVKRRFEHLFYFFKREKRVELLQTSLILKNPPFGYEEQDDFFNSIVVLQTDMGAFKFLDYLMRVEKKFGRKRSFRNGPRTLDLDIIFFDDRKIATQKLTVPHSDWKNRVSVLIPLHGVNR